MAHFWGNLKARLFGGTYYSRDKFTGEIEKSTYKNGKKTGPFELYTSNGELFEKGTYQNGIKSGPFERFYNDSTKKGTYENGKVEGLVDQYRKDGTLEKRFFYEKDRMSGPYEEYSRSGKLLRTGFHRLDDSQYGDMSRKNGYYRRELRDDLTKALDKVNQTVPPSPLRKRLKESMVKEFRLNHPKMKRGSEK